MCLPGLLPIALLLPIAVAQTGVGIGSVAARPAAHPGVQAIAGMSNTPPAIPPHADKTTLELGAVDGWRDSGIFVVAGEAFHVTARGTLHLPDGRTSGPDGVARGWKDLLRQFPLNGAATGALLARVSDDAAAVPFTLPLEGTATAPTSGRLYLRINLADDLLSEGAYTVSLKLDPKASPAAKAQAATEQAAVHIEAQTAAPPIASLIDASTFADLPRRVADKDGNPGDMINFALVGTESQVDKAFAAAGWVAVDRSVEDAILHGLLATLGHEAYTAMPMSQLYLFHRPQDLSFARGDPLKVAAERHHLRIWKTATTIAGRPLWIGSATHDIGFERDQRNGDVTHRIDPAIDEERTFLLHSFDAAGAFSSAAYVTPFDPVRTASTATGGDFHSDGRVLAMELK